MKPRVLYICGTLNQTTQLVAVSRALGDHDAWFSPYYGDRGVDTLRRLHLIEMTIGGNKFRRRTLESLESRNLRIDSDGRRGPYDLALTCTDVVVPKNVRNRPLVLVQEGILDPERFLAWLCRRAPMLPRWFAGTSFTGESGLCDRICVASEGYRDQFIARGIDPARIVTTGIPNFDDCARFLTNDFPHRGYVLAATSDTRETFKYTDSRDRFLRKVLRIANGRPVIVKLHPNENAARERRRVARIAPQALVFSDGNASEMVANCDVLVAEWSSLAFVGCALGKEVHSNWSNDVLRRLLPVQNGGTSADNVARVCRTLLGLPEARTQVLTAEASP